METIRTYLPCEKMKTAGFHFYFEAVPPNLGDSQSPQPVCDLFYAQSNIERECRAVDHLHNLVILPLERSLTAPYSMGDGTDSDSLENR